MKLKKLKLLSLVFIFILSYVYTYNTNKPVLLLNDNIENQSKFDEGMGLAKKISKSDFKLVEGDNITIKNDEEWSLYAFKGNGTKEDPHIIENKRIAIFDVEFTNKAFIIKNCTFSEGFQFLLWSAKLMSKIENSTFEYTEKMQFRNIYNMLIENCLFVSIEGDTWSIEIIGSNTIAINNSLFFDVSLEILETKWLQLTDNNIRNKNNSLEITDSHDIAIKNNTIFAENMVAYVAYSYNVDIANNTFSGNYTGKILTYRTTNITFQRNFFTELLTVYFFVEEEILCIEENTFLDIPRCVNLCALKLIMNNNILTNAMLSIPNYYTYTEDFKNIKNVPEADDILFNIYYNVIEMNNNSYNGQPINYIQNQNGLLINTTINGVLILSNTLATIENISFKQILPLIIIEGSDVLIQNCTFADNFISVNVFRSKVKINNCSFINSKNGIVALDDSNIDISNSTFTGLSAGIISALGLKITYTNNDFNASTFGIRTYGTNSVKISNNRFYDVLWPIEISETANINIIANKIALIVKLTSKTNLRPSEERLLQSPFGAVESAIALGADAVAATVYWGSQFEHEMLKQWIEIKKYADVYGLPALQLAYPRGPTIKNMYDVEIVRYGARAAVESGADLIKTYYTGSRETFAKVVEAASGVPVLMSGGPRREKPIDFLRDVKAVMEAGGKGVVVGRNVFQHKDPKAMMKAIVAIVHEDKDPEDVGKNL